MKSRKKNYLAESNLDPGIRWIDEVYIKEYLHISGSTLDKWHRTRGLSKYPVGKKVYYKEQEINEMIEKHKKPGQTNNTH